MSAVEKWSLRDQLPSLFGISETTGSLAVAVEVPEARVQYELLTYQQLRAIGDEQAKAEMLARYQSDRQPDELD